MTYFEEFLNEHRRGGMLSDLSEKLQDAVEDAMESGKEASITVQIIIKPEGTDRVFVADKITTKAPQRSVPASLFFVTPNNRLTRKDPHQLRLEDLTKPDYPTGGTNE